MSLGRRTLFVFQLASRWAVVALMTLIVSWIFVASQAGAVSAPAGGVGLQVSLLSYDTSTDLAQRPAIQSVGSAPQAFDSSS